MPPPPLLLLQDIHLKLGAQDLLAGAELSVGAGERIGLVGRNGSGKSTLLKIAASLLPHDSGTRFLQPGTTVRYLPQEPDLSGFATVLDYVEAGLGPNDDPYRAAMLLDQLKLTGREEPANLSGGEVRRAALAATLAPNPDLLLLDEPTNHLDLPAIEWLESELSSLRSALVVISHDRRLLEQLTRSVVWLDRGTARRMEQGFAHFENWRDAVLEEEERDHHKLDRQIAREEHWMRYGVTARRKRNMRRVGELADLRQRFKEERPPSATLNMAAQEATGSGKLVIVAEHIEKTYGDRLIVRDFSVRILRGDRVGIVGPNGAGKTTLLSMLTGESDPDSGKIVMGSNVHRVQLDQQRAQLDPDKTLSDTLTGGGDYVMIGEERRHVIGYMKDFLFRPEQARTAVGKLSGGERGRLLLAYALSKQSNLLVLDEPTNDLDLETLDLLQDLLANYAGTVLLISHDRDFLDRVVTTTIAAEGEGSFISYAGGYTDMLRQRALSAPEETIAASPSKPSGTSKASSAKPNVSKPKMSFKDKHLLETLPGKIDAFQKSIQKEQAILADAGLFSRNPTEFAAATKRLQQAEEALTEAEHKWLELELRGEEQIAAR